MQLTYTPSTLQRTNLTLKARTTKDIFRLFQTLDKQSSPYGNHNARRENSDADAAEYANVQGKGQWCNRKALKCSDAINNNTLAKQKRPLEIPSAGWVYPPTLQRKQKRMSSNADADLMSTPCFDPLRPPNPFSPQISNHRADEAQDALHLGRRQRRVVQVARLAAAPDVLEPALHLPLLALGHDVDEARVLGVLERGAQYVQARLRRRLSRSARPPSPSAGRRDSPRRPSWSTP